MKTLCTLLLVGIGFSAVAQRSLVNKHITTDGRQLRIRVDIETAERSIHYNRLFDVADMEAKAIKALENRVIDSLEQRAAGQPELVMATPTPNAEKTNKPCKEQVAIAMDNNDPSLNQLEANAALSLSPGDVAPSSVLVKEDKENGRLWMQYTFQKDGDELVIERTANVIGKSEREKQAIIRETERSFGIKTGNQ